MVTHFLEAFLKIEGLIGLKEGLISRLEVLGKFYLETSSESSTLLQSKRSSAETGFSSLFSSKALELVGGVVKVVSVCIIYDIIMVYILE